MKFFKQNSQVFVPDGGNAADAIKKTTHLAIAAHQDDVELMALHGILHCFGAHDKHFTGVVTSDGAGSPRNGMYKDYTDEQIKVLRIAEQKKAAVVGEYAAMVMLDYASKEIKSAQNDDIVRDYVSILQNTKPEVVYTHNLADKHDTHIGVAVKVITAIRRLPKDQRPKKVYGCEVWRDLDWLSDDKKIMLDTSSFPNIANALVGVFDSQITGGKRYDLAAAGRRTAHATYGASHKVDNVTGASYAMDLTPLSLDDELHIAEFVSAHIREFEQDVAERLNKLL